MTRNTKLYKVSCTIDKKKQDIYYRDLNALEYSFLSNIKNDLTKKEMAAKTVIIKMDPDKVPFGTLLKIGEDIIGRLDMFLESPQLFDISINEFREGIKKDDAMLLIGHIMTFFPGQSFTELIKLNIKDLIELVCLCEHVIGKPIFDNGKKQQHHGLINKSKLPDDGKSLQEKMNALNGHLGIPK